MYKFEVLLKDIEGVESWYTFHDSRFKTPELALAKATLMYPGMRVRVKSVVNKHQTIETASCDA